MAFEVVNPEDFSADGILREDEFLRKTDEYDWSQYDNKKVLVRGCGAVPVPPWAYMIITAKLMPFARSVRYGNEHDNLVVFRRKTTEKA